MSIASAITPTNIVTTVEAKKSENTNWGAYTIPNLSRKNGSVRADKKSNVDPCGPLLTEIEREVHILHV